MILVRDIYVKLGLTLVLVLVIVFISMNDFL